MTKRIIIALSLLLLVSCSSNSITNKNDRVQYSVESKYAELAEEEYYTVYDKAHELMMVIGDPDQIHHYFAYDSSSDSDNKMNLFVFFGDDNKKVFMITKYDGEYSAYTEDQGGILFLYSDGEAYNFNNEIISIDKDLESLFQNGLKLYQAMENHFSDVTFSTYMEDAKNIFITKGDDYLLDEYIQSSH